MSFDRKTYSKRYYLEHREQILEVQKKSHKQWRIKNRDKLLAQVKQYNLEHKEQIREYAKRYKKNRHKINIKVNLRNKVKTAIWKSLNINKTGGNWKDLVGYTLKELRNHLEKTMPEGYAWQDYLNGKLQIDHIIPIRAFVFDKPEDTEFKDCWDLCNLRLLTAIENRMKRSNLNNPILLGLCIRWA